MQENDDREIHFIYSNENPIKINNNGKKFNKLFIEDFILCENTRDFKEIVFLESSHNIDNIANCKRFDKLNNRAIGMYHPIFSFSSWNKENGSLLLFSKDNSFTFFDCNEICIYLKDNTNLNQMDTSNIYYLLIYSFE